MEASEPVAIFGPAGDHRQGAACVQRRMPAGYPLNLHVNETDDASTVTAFMSAMLFGDDGAKAYRWQVRLTQTVTELRSNETVWGEPFADQPVYDAIKACGLLASR
jgi:hypothetical protein